ncbi:DMT family transporter [Streptomyces pseudovenezuelae]|uniref:Drug/metabolite transporter (DMT)-like permease n=1 Tax=Streptomyces pseudovenezuelae TaxID=67350 RepID=A0ABT6LWI0_9ACTN|nr:DMT family transporter [Streptomyces pseudovenezuelae]MDH6220672.1 drug/metabolite transporter (DMT)-like permease [Streptomyces pseudovenezuelae]
MNALALSVLLSLVSAVAYAGGAIVQEHVAVSSPDGQYAPLRRPTWWAAVALNGLGGILHVAALAYGPLSLVQPLGALTIVFALPMAALFVGRKAGATAWRGAIMATVGLAGLLSLVGASDSQSLDTAQRVGVAVVTGGVVVALMIAGRAAHRHPAVRSMLLATGSGIAFGMSSVFTKTVAVDWTGGVTMADLPSLAVIGVFATAGMLLSQASYRGAGLAAPLATLTVVNPVIAAAVGITMFGETFRYGTTGTALALSCGVVAAGGLILLTTERLSRTTAEAAPALPEPAAAPAEERLVALPEQPVAARREDVREREELRKEVLVPAQAQGAAAAPDKSYDADADASPGNTAGAEAADEDVEATPYGFAGPFFGGTYLPLPLVDRHRVRVKS